jgi:GH24 family phage-related lysozyme (muramidase)
MPSNPALPAPASNPVSGAPADSKKESDSGKSKPNETQPSPSFPLPDTGTSQNRGENGTPKTTATLSCPGACIKLGEKGPLIEEINIRLTGFGGTVQTGAPLNEFTLKTERAIKQFQRDYMGAAETGKICGSLLIALDEFRKRFPIDFSSMKCRCGHCNGFGNGLIDSTKAGLFSDKNKTEPFDGIEYPGLHRALPWALRAAIYYAEHVDKDLGFKFLAISSGYRCWHDNAIHKRNTTNHMGNALDIQFTRHDAKSRCSGNDVDTLRTEIFIKRLGAQLGWIDKNKLSLETSKQGARSWVHVDVRDHEQQYKDYRFYAIAQTGTDGDSMVEMTRREGKLGLISCGGLPPTKAIPIPLDDLAQADKKDRADIQSLTISKEGIAFIKGWEKYNSQPYDDSRGFCTIGWGHLIKRDSCEAIRNEEDFKQYKQGISQTAADDFLIEDIKRMENIVRSRVQAPLFQHEYDALVSLIFNIGSFKNCPKLLSKLNTKDYSGCCDEFFDITNNGTPGLVKRRQSEMNLFRNNLYDSTH